MVLTSMTENKQYQLSPTQEKAAKEVCSALAFHPVVQLSPSAIGEGLRPGVGLTTIYRFIEERIDQCKVISLKDVLCADSKGVHPVSRVFQRAIKIWDDENTDTVILDDLDLISGPKTIYSNRFTSAGESQGFYRTSAEPSVLLKALIDYALQNGKKLIFNAIEDHFLRFTGLPYVVHLKHFTVEDYKFFLQKWISEEKLSSVNPGLIFKRFPALSPAELKVAAVPQVLPSATDLDISETYAKSLRDAYTLNTEQVIENITCRLGESHGALPLAKVEKVDLAQMTGMDKIVKTLEAQIIKPFENYIDPDSKFSDPKAGVLLFGPPGTGKTSIGRGLAHRLKGKMFMVKEIFLMKQLVETFAKAEASAPSVIFFDDIDVLLHRHKVAWGGGEVFRFLLSKMDGMTSGKDNKKFVTIIMTCESPKSLPDALIRSGRIELWLKLEYPKGKQRLEILSKFLQKEGQTVPEMAQISRKFLSTISDRTEDFSAADLRRLVQDTKNMFAYAKALQAEREDGSAAADPNINDILEDAVEDLRKMRDEVESFMKQMYQ